MKTLKEHKGKILALVVFLVVIFLYKILFSTNEAVIESGTSAQIVGQDIIALNASIGRINLESPLFNSRPFKNLIDFTVTVLPQPIGRNNPFDVIGR